MQLEAIWVKRFNGITKGQCQFVESHSHFVVTELCKEKITKHTLKPFIDT